MQYKRLNVCCQILVLVTGPGAGVISTGGGHGGRAGRGVNQHEETGSPYGLYSAPCRLVVAGAAAVEGQVEGVLSLYIRHVLNVEGKADDISQLSKFTISYAVLLSKES